VSVLRKKYQLPTIAELPQIKIDLLELQYECNKFSSKYVDVKTANPQLCMNHEKLVSDVYDNFEQINLTELNGNPMPYTNNIKERIRRREETLYNKKTKDYIGSYFENIVEQFNASAMRVRITKLLPKTEITFHIDYDPSYATRIIIPIYTDKKVKNLFKVRKNIEEYNLKAGKAYFINGGFAHAVKNDSDTSRIALMFSLDGQDDLIDVKERNDTYYLR